MRAHREIPKLHPDLHLHKAKEDMNIDEPKNNYDCSLVQFLQAFHSVLSALYVSGLETFSLSMIPKDIPAIPVDCREGVV